jgi:hypothetical protein
VTMPRRPHRCPPDDVPCARCEKRAEDRADPELDWIQRDLDLMADAAAARDYGGLR